MQQGPSQSVLYGSVLAAGIPLFAALAAASPAGYWLDGDELVAASVELGISHPPGQPLAVLFGYLCTLIPAGSLSFRVALGSALAASAASFFLFRALVGTLATLGLSADQLRAPIALAGTLTVVGTAGFLFQAVRPEVYALQAALVAFALDRLVEFYRRRPRHDSRVLYVACAGLGLALTNHHLLGFLLLPALAPALAIGYRELGGRPVVVSITSMALPLVGFLYLPARALANPPLNLGDPDSPARFYWVVSAQVYQKNQGTGVPEPIVDRFLDVLVLLTEQFHWAMLLGALLGGYVLLRVPRARGVGVLWVLVLLVFCAARGWLGFVRSNPDAVGYLLPGFMALGALFTAFLGAVSLAVQRASRVIGWLLWLLPFSAGVWVWHGADASNLATFSDSDAFTEVERRTLPNRAALIVHDPQTAFRLFGAQATAGFRPDVDVIAMPFLAYPGVANALAKKEPALVPVLRSALLAGVLSIPAIQDVTKKRPLMLELDPRVLPEVYSTLVPSYAYHQVLDSEAYQEDRRPGQLRQDKGWQLLEHLLPTALEPETSRRLLWRGYHDALYFAAAGNVDAALLAADRGLAHYPETRELIALKAALQRHEEGKPLDVTPFLIGAYTVP